MAPTQRNIHLYSYQADFGDLYSNDSPWILFFVIGLLLFLKKSAPALQNRANSDGGSVKEAVCNNLAITTT